MPKRKLKRFAENSTFPHFFQPSFDDLAGGFILRGNWNSDFFRNDHPIVLELGCGKGEYTTGLARQSPGFNFIGIDIKGARMWKGARESFEEGLSNVAFLRTRIDLIGQCFAPGEIHEIWITFPDPQPKRPRRRLTHPGFLKRYASVVSNGHIIHLKTDNRELFDYTIGVIMQEHHHILFQTTDLYLDKTPVPASAIQTFYEEMFLKQGIPINYLRFSLNMPDRNNHTISGQ